MRATAAIPKPEDTTTPLNRFGWRHLDDRYASWSTPRWVHASWIASAVITGGVAAVLYLPWPVALMFILSAAVAGGAWMMWTYQRVLSRRIMPIYILTISVVLLLQFESWGLGFPEAQQAWVASGTTGMAFTEAVYISAFPGAGTCLFLLGAIGLFFHHPLASFLGWLLFAQAIGQGLLPWLLLIAAGGGYVPGMSTGVLAMGIGIAGLRRCKSLAIHVPQERDHA